MLQLKLQEVEDARFIAFINTAVESPLGQVAMIPLLDGLQKCSSKI